ncbi:MAG: type II toxin-antitoxin system VapC family toxin [Lachnospiraceae bacterium]|nr:type II toxin-antitoxin system VapC family toxin [Lachnospiraceae bacterium]
MSGIDYLADTNAIIYLLSGNDCMRPYVDKKLAVSAISYMELLSYSGLKPDDEAIIRNLLRGCTLLNLSRDVMEETISIRKERRIKLPDSIIAGTAIINDIPLLTADMGFEKIDGLKVVLLKP